MKILLFLIFFLFVITPIAYGTEISAVPEKGVFGPNDWIKIFLYIDGYSGGVVNWNATQPDGTSISGSLTNLRESKTTHTIIRNAFDNQFGHWKIEYQYNDVKKLIDVEIEPITVSVTTDKLVYDQYDSATIQFSTNYFNPNSVKSELLHLKILDEKGIPAKLIQDVNIKVSQSNIIQHLSLFDLLKYNPPGNYYVTANYYNVKANATFAVYDTYSKTIFLGSDKTLYDPGDSVEINIITHDLSSGSGILTITSPSGKVHTKAISDVLPMNRVKFDGITSSEIGTYTVRFDYGGNISTKTFDVLIESLAKPTLSGLDIDIFLDKSQYRPGELVNATVITNKSLKHDVVYWFEDSSGNQSEKTSFVTHVSTFSIPHILDKTSLHGTWKIHVKSDTTASSAIFVISGQSISSEKIHVDIFIPNWIRENVDWWIKNQITDNDFSTGIKFMINEKIIQIPNLTHSASSETQIPYWVKNIAGWWADGLLSDQEFANALKFLVISDIIQV